MGLDCSRQCIYLSLAAEAHDEGIGVLRHLGHVSIAATDSDAVLNAANVLRRNSSNAPATIPFELNLDACWSLTKCFAAMLFSTSGQHIALPLPGTCRDAEVALKALAGCLQLPAGSGYPGTGRHDAAATVLLRAQFHPTPAQTPRPPDQHSVATAALP